MKMYAFLKYFYDQVLEQLYQHYLVRSSSQSARAYHQLTLLHRIAMFHLSRIDFLDELDDRLIEDVSIRKAIGKVQDLPNMLWVVQQLEQMLPELETLSIGSGCDLGQTPWFHKLKTWWAAAAIHERYAGISDAEIQQTFDTVMGFQEDEERMPFLRVLIPQLPFHYLPDLRELAQATSNDELRACLGFDLGFRAAQGLQECRDATGIRWLDRHSTTPPLKVLQIPRQLSAQGVWFDPKGCVYQGRVTAPFGDQAWQVRSATCAVGIDFLQLPALVSRAVTTDAQQLLPLDENSGPAYVVLSVAQRNGAGEITYQLWLVEESDAVAAAQCCLEQSHTWLMEQGASAIEHDAGAALIEAIRSAVG